MHLTIHDTSNVDKRIVRIKIDKNDQNENCAALRLGDECGERNPGQLVCGCSNIGLFTMLLLLLLLTFWFLGFIPIFELSAGLRMHQQCVDFW